MSLKNKSILLFIINLTFVLFSNTALLYAQSLEINYGPYEELANVNDTRINEASGIAASLYVPDAYWVHNDSGDAANIFLCNPQTGATITSGLVENAKNRDWEDMASFRINEKSYLIIGSFGDNARKRSQYELYIMEEPVAGDKGPFPYLNKINYTYEGGSSYNCESVAVDVAEGKIYLLTKTGSPDTSQVYSLPLALTQESDKVQIAEYVASPKIKSATGMDISPNGLRAVIVTNKNNECKAFQFTKLPGETWTEGFSGTPSIFNTPIRPTYEAICFALDGETLYDKSEKGNFGKFSVINQNLNVEATENQSNKVTLVRDDEKQKVDVLIDGKLFTSYVYPNNIKKPVLYPLITPKGTKITRKFPLEPSVGERVDHPHHVGVWFNYGDVNGLDFWNNSDSIKVEKRDHYGTIVHQKIESIQSKNNEGRLSVRMDWLSPKGEVLLKETTTFIFRSKENEHSIDRITTLTAVNVNVDFKDNKEGVLGIRVTRTLELPSNKPDIFTDANGLPTKVAALNNDGVNGDYINSEGDKGLDCWGKRADWVNLHSNIGNEKISLAIIDHKSNVGYPTYWHARGYGLFAANPLGQEVFSKGKEQLNFKLAKGESVTFKHRIIVSSSHLSKGALDATFSEFSKN